MNSTPNNLDHLMNSDNSQNRYEHTPTKIDNNSELMTESEVIQFLRIPEISNSKNYHNVIEHLKKFRGFAQNSYMPEGFVPQKGHSGMDGKRN